MTKTDDDFQTDMRALTRRAPLTGFAATLPDAARESGTIFRRHSALERAVETLQAPMPFPSVGFC